MNQTDNISAFTPSDVGSFPPYISINRVDRQGFIMVEITVRSPAEEIDDLTLKCGSSSHIAMTPEQFRKLIKDTLERMEKFEL